MPELNLKSIEVIDEISRDDFQHNFFVPKKPVILKSYASTWPAMEKWTLDYFKQSYGDLQVPVYEEAFANTGQSYTNADKQMPFAQYLDMISHGPTKLRMFLFNIFKHVPSLCDDFDFPDIASHYLTKHPFMFFGGEGSWVDAHYDLDLSDLFLTQFDGRKRIILYAPEYSAHLYRHPLTVSCNVDLRQPDFERYPKLAEAKGYECVLERGDTLYIPRAYWHFVDYQTGGFSLTLRALSKNPLVRAKSLMKIFNLTVLDHRISKMMGAQRWYDMKEKMAVKRAVKL